MTDTAPRRLDAQRRVAATARQISRQRRGAALLGELLARAAAEGLPAVAWTIGSADAELAGRCEARRMHQRRQDFDAWRLAIGAWRPGCGRQARVRRHQRRRPASRPVGSVRRRGHIPDRGHLGGGFPFGSE